MNYKYHYRIIDNYILKALSYHIDSLVKIYKSIFKNKEIMKKVFIMVPNFYNIYLDHYYYKNKKFYDCSIEESIVRCWKTELVRKIYI
jgi:hypothetical protein